MNKTNKEKVDSRMKSKDKKVRRLSEVVTRSWDKVVEPLLRYDPHSSSLNYPLDLIFQLQRYLARGNTLRLNLPTTLSGTKDNCLKTTFLTQEQEVGRLSYQENVLKSNFDADIDREVSQRIAKLCEKKEVVLPQQLMPYVLIKEKLYGHENKVQLLTMQYNREEYKKIVNVDVNQITQLYIYTNSKFASLTRFFFYPLSNNSQAYKIDNVEPCVLLKATKQSWRVKVRNHNSVIYVKVMHTNKSFFQQSMHLVKALEKSLHIAIKRIVTDWILDTNNRYYLIQVLEVISEPKAVKPIKEIGDGLSYIGCAVCQQTYHLWQIHKLITCKMIYQFFQHLKKRQIHLSFQYTSKYSSDTVKTCDNCYQLVVKELELMRYENQMAIITNGASQTLCTAFIPAKISSKTKSMHQWRLFLYFQDIRDLHLLNLPQNKTYYLMAKIHHSITCFKLTSSLIRGIKIHYLYSQKDKIQKFLTETQITLRITSDNNWDARVAQGNTNGLYEQSQKASLRKFKQILMFNSEAKYCVVGVHIGIRLEGVCQWDTSIMKEYFDVCIAPEQCYNCYPLPAEWMQIIDPTYCHQNKEEELADAIRTTAKSSEKKKKSNQKRKNTTSLQRVKFIKHLLDNRLPLLNRKLILNKLKL